MQQYNRSGTTHEYIVIRLFSCTKKEGLENFLKNFLESLILAAMGNDH